MFCSDLWSILHPGVALKHVYEKVFTSDSGMRKNVPKVLVVVTDGRSQDDVKKSAEKLQHSGMCGITHHIHTVHHNNQTVSFEIFLRAEASG